MKIAINDIWKKLWHQIRHFNLNIQQRFQFLAAMVILAFILTLGGAGLSIKILLNYKDYDDRIDGVVNRFEQMNRNMDNILMQNNFSRNFYKNEAAVMVGTYGDLYQKLNEELRLLSNNELSQSIGVSDDLDKISELLKLNIEQFRNLIFIKKDLGNTEFGVISTLNTKAEEALILSDEEYEKKILLLLKKHKNYLITGDSTYIKDFNLQYGNLVQTIQKQIDTLQLDTLITTEMLDDSLITDTIIINPADSLQLLYSKLRDYESALQKTVVLNQKLNSPTTGIAIEIKNLENKLLHLFYELQSKAQQAKDAKIKQILPVLFSSIVFLLILLVFFIFLFSLSIIRPVKKLKLFIARLSLGIVPDKRLKVTTKDEVGELIQSANNLARGMHNITNFAIAIGNNDFSMEFKPLSDNDKLGKALLDMRNSLKEAQEAEVNRRQENEKRRWATDGFTKLTNLLRQNNDNLSELSYSVITNLVKYLSINQGGLFMLNDAQENEEPYLELMASYAYDREKFLEKKVMLGEGLLGMTAIEKKTTYLTEVPGDYLEVTSGFGNSEPASLLIVPLIEEDILLGIIELASFSKFEPYQIEFTENVAEVIASTLNSVRMNEQTTRLLQQSQQQSEQMASQEEEMRQNIEELQSTQEEAARREAEMQGLLNGLNTSFYVAEIDLNGNFININQRFLQLLEMDKEVALQIDFFNYFHFPPDLQVDIIREAKAGHAKKMERHLTALTEKPWLSLTFTPVYNKEEVLEKLLVIGINITERKLQEDEINILLAESQKKAQQLSEQEAELVKNLENTRLAKEQAMESEVEMRSIFNGINSSFLVAEFDMTGRITDINSLFLQKLGLIKGRVIGKTELDFINYTTEEKEKYLTLWDNLQAGKIQNKEQKVVINDKIIWISETYTPIFDKNNQPFKVINIAIDITEMKEKHFRNLKEIQHLDEKQEEERQQHDEILRQKEQEFAKKEENYLQKIKELQQQLNK